MAELLDLAIKSRPVKYIRKKKTASGYRYIYKETEKKKKKPEKPKDDYLDKIGDAKKIREQLGKEDSDELAMKQAQADKIIDSQLDEQSAERMLNKDSDAGGGNISNVAEYRDYVVEMVDASRRVKGERGRKLQSIYESMYNILKP